MMAFVGALLNPLHLTIFAVFSRFGTLRTVVKTFFTQSVSRAERQKICI